MKKLLYLIVALAVIFGVVYLVKNKKETVVVVPPVTTNPTSMNLCFYHEAKTARGFYDIALLKLNIMGDKVTGEFRNLPAEKDSKTGTFEGTVGPVDKMAMARTADVWFDAHAEGMVTTEQLKIVFGEGNAQVGFGVMKDRGDGVYVYQDPNHLTYSATMTDVACDFIDDKLIVEKYVRDNIATIALEKSVLGGTWYALNIHIDPATKTGVTGYEDGHIQGKVSFSYERTGQVVTISNVKKL